MTTTERSVSTSPPDREPAPGEPAIAVETFVREERGQFTVDIVVMFPDGGVTRSVNSYRTRRHAEIAASWIKRAAQRDIEGPING